MATTVVIATNDRKSVYKTVESVEKQTHPVEIIVIDDGSEYPVTIDDKNIILLRNKEPLGLSVCRNMGIEKAKGNFIAFIDDDAVADQKGIENLEKR